MSLISITNELTVSDIKKQVDFYENIFDFKIELADNNFTWIKLKKDNLNLMLEDYNEVTKEIKNFPKKTNSSNLIKFEYNNLDEFNNIYKRCKDNSCLFFQEYTKTEYGKIEFGIFDLDNNMILISIKDCFV